jgi:hypothetical protein
VLICSDYEGGADWLEGFVPELLAVNAERLYCMADASLRGRNHEAKPMHEWFGARGGVLVHLSWNSLEKYDHLIGIGVDTEVVRFRPEQIRNTIVFDFQTVQAWKQFRPELLPMLRDVLPGCRFLGSGPKDCPVKESFDGWVAYGEAHSSYVRVFNGCAAFIPGCAESMGLPVAEAQVSGACIVYPHGYIHKELICPSANKIYDGTKESLVQALRESLMQNTEQIVREATERFDAIAWASRVRRAIGLNLASPGSCYADLFCAGLCEEEARRSSFYT